jgi:hypothetical protein
VDMPVLGRGSSEQIAANRTRAQLSDFLLRTAVIPTGTTRLLLSRRCLARRVAERRDHGKISTDPSFEPRVGAPGISLP